MKKLIPILLILIFIGCGGQAVIQSLIKHRNVNYSIKTKDNSYLIKEKMIFQNKKSNYYFEILDKENHYFDFYYSGEFNRQSNVIKDIKYYNYNDLYCIFPIFKRGKNDDIFCNYKKKQVSYSYLKQINNTDINKVIKELKKQNYNYSSWKDSNSSIKEDNYDIYIDNIPNDMIFTMWFYKGIYVLKDGKIDKRDWLNNDTYENNISAIVGRFYVSVNTDQTSGNEYAEFYLTDIKNSGKNRIDIDPRISTNMYVNGEYDGKYYYTDLNNKIQYSLNPEKGKIEEVGNEKDGFKILINNKLENINSKEFLKDKVYFTNDVTNNVLETKYDAVSVKEDNQYYYFLTKNGDFCRISIDDLKNPVYLFNFSNVSEWSVKNNNIKIVIGDMLYFYNDNSGLVPIIKNSELKYNYKNICDFTEK